MTGLILAGSHEARSICDILNLAKIPAIASLAGVTKKPLNLSLKTHFGGFGGVDGFKKFIQNERIEWVINATHPFASTMRNTSTKICKELKINHLPSSISVKRTLFLRTSNTLRQSPPM